MLSTNIKAQSLKINEYASIDGKSACVFLSSISVNENGYVAWMFERYKYDDDCKTAKIDFVRSSPKNNIRGTKHLKEDNTFSFKFTILTTPETKSLSVLSLNTRGNSGWGKFNAKGKIPELLEISKLGDWKNNFTNSESLLKEKKLKDKIPPKIEIFRPNLNNKKQLIVDTYSSFIRGKVSDENGILNLLVNDQKVRIKDDGTFVSKVKLVFGKNEIVIKAEDINNNISQKK